MNQMTITKAVGKNAPNEAADVKTIHKRLMDVGKIKCYECNGAMDDEILRGIVSVQKHFMLAPDGVISPGGTTLRYLSAWSDKPVSPGVQLPGRLREAWDLVNPLLPEGSYCSSGYRSESDQRRILQKFFQTTYRTQIISKYTKTKYDEVSKDLVKNEQRVLEMVRGVGQAIAAPGKSAHQKGKAVDVGGPSTIDQKQVDIIKSIARVHATLFNGTVLKERNGCVHFEIR